MNASPKRIQRKRTKGWKMPAGAISVARPGRYGNPFLVVGNSVIGMDWIARKDWDCGVSGRPYVDNIYISTTSPRCAASYAVSLYEQLLSDRQRDWPAARFEKWIRGARGVDLCCFCPLDEPCHADVLLEIANP